MTRITTRRRCRIACIALLAQIVVGGCTHVPPPPPNGLDVAADQRTQREVDLKAFLQGLRGVLENGLLKTPNAIPNLLGYEVQGTSSAERRQPPFNLVVGFQGRSKYFPDHLLVTPRSVGALFRAQVLEAFGQPVSTDFAQGSHGPTTRSDFYQASGNGGWVAFVYSVETNELLRIVLSQSKTD